MLDTWIYCLPATMSAVQAQETPPKLAAQAVTGFWKPYLTIYEVYNVIGNQDEITELLDALEADTAGSVSKVFQWIWRDGHDDLDGVNGTVPVDVLAVMKDRKTYDIDGNETSSTPATYENPNWGHTFFGQKDRIFAGDHNSTDFNEDYN